MRIGEDYGVRLNQKFSNLKQGSLITLSQSYSSHSFVIDKDEACALFQRVRWADEREKLLVQKIAPRSRFPSDQLILENHTDLFVSLEVETLEQETDDERNHQPEKRNGPAKKRRERASNLNGGNSKPAGQGRRAAAEPERA